MKKIFAKVALASVLVASGASQASAVPSLGIGTDYGYLNPTQPYQTTWGPAVAGPGGAGGFLLGPSGSTLHVWSNLLNADIYLLTTKDVASGYNITFNGAIAQFTSPDVFSGYASAQYYGVNLGKVDPGSWSALSSSPFSPHSFYYTDVTLNYTGNIGANDFIFAVADSNGVTGLQAKNGSYWVDDNGLTGIQEKATTVWVESNAVTGTQEKSGKDKINGKWVTYPADTQTNYPADTLTRYKGDDFSPVITAANGFDPPPQVPEPAVATLLAVGFVGAIAFGTSRRKKGSG